MLAMQDMPVMLVLSGVIETMPLKMKVTAATTIMSWTVFFGVKERGDGAWRTCFLLSQCYHDYSENTSLDYAVFALTSAMG